MLSMLETWLLNKTSKNPKTFWTKVGVWVLLTILTIVVFIKYNYFKDQVEKVKTKDLLADDDKKDAVLQQQLDQIAKNKSSLIKEVIQTDSKINVVDGDLVKNKKEAVSDLKSVESIHDWDDVDKKIK